MDESLVVCKHTSICLKNIKQEVMVATMFSKLMTNIHTQKIKRKLEFFLEGANILFFISEIRSVQAPPNFLTWKCSLTSVCIIHKGPYLILYNTTTASSSLCQSYRLTIFYSGFTLIIANQIHCRRNILAKEHMRDSSKMWHH